MQQLADLARRWLKPEIRSAAGVVKQVVLERFVAGLPAAKAAWVRCNRPSSLSTAVTRAEDHMHGDIHKYPLVPLKLHYQGKKHRLKAVVSSRL